MCLDEFTLAELVTGRLDAAAVVAAEEHLDTCQKCFDLLAAVARSTANAATTACSSGLSSSDAADVPHQIDEYRLMRRIGAGGMGEVFLARDTRLDRPVAVKLLRGEIRSTARQRFLIEARAVARLSHPNVVTIHRVGEIGDRSYLVQEFVPGRSLDTLPKPLPWARALELAVGLARGLAAAHRAGVLHRDIKPANAILSDDGVVKLLDFGLAKLVELGAQAGDGTDSEGDAGLLPVAPLLTSAGTLLGTPHYMPPESWQGAAPDASADIYSLGAVVHELCTGHRIHPGHTIAEVSASARERDAAPLAAEVPGIDPGFAAIIDRCLRRDPSARWPSADAMCSALVQALGRTSSPPILRRRVVALIGVVAAAAAVASLLVLAFTGTKAAAPVGGAPTDEVFRAGKGELLLWLQTAGPGEKSIDAVARDRQGNLYVVGHASDDFQLAGRVVKAAHERGFSFIARLDPAGKVAWVRPVVSTGDIRLGALAVDNLGAVVVAGSYSGQVRDTELPARSSRPDCFVAQVDAEAGKLIWARACGATAGHANALAVDRRGTIYVAGEIEGSASFTGDRSLGAPGVRALFLVTYTPTGGLRWAWVPRGGTRARLRGLAISDDALYVGGVVQGDFELDAAHVLQHDRLAGFVGRFAPDSGALVWAHSSTATGGGLPLALALSPDGKRLATGGAGASRDTWVSTMDAATGATLGFTTVAAPPGATIEHLAFDRSGHVLAMGGYRGHAAAGDLAIDAIGARDIFLAVLDAELQPLRLRSWGGPGVDRANGLQVDGDTITMVGRAQAGFRLGAPVASGPGAIGFLAELDLPALLAQPAPRVCYRAVDAGLISWWSGDDNANDLLGHNDGMPGRGVSFAPGRIGPAFRFDGGVDGEGWVEATSSGMPTGAADRSIALWARIDSTPADFAFLAGYGEFGTPQRSFALGAELNVITGRLRLHFSSWGDALFAPAAPKLGQWFHVVVTSEGGRQTLYLDGRPVVTGMLLLATPPGSRFFLGKLPGEYGTRRRLLGAIDEVRVYGRALSEREVEEMYELDKQCGGR